MSDRSRAGAALLAGASGVDWARLVTAARGRLLEVLRDDPPDPLVEYVLDGDDPELPAAMAWSAALLTRRPETAGHLAARVTPADALAANMTTRHWEYRHWETLLSRFGGGDPAWQDADPARVPLQVASVLALSPLPVHRSLVEGRSRHKLTARELAHCLARLHRGTDLPGDLPADLDRNVVARVREAAGEPGGLDRLLAEYDSTATALTELRAEHRVFGAVDDTARERAVLDWDEVAASHAVSPLPEAAAAALTARGDCPGDVRLALYTTHPHAVAGKTAGPFAPLFEVPGHAEAAGRLVARAGRDGRVEELVAHGRPAAAVLATARGEKDRVDPETWGLTPVHTLVRPILTETVGEEPAKWRALRRLVGDHPGTVAELCADAAAAPDHGTAWPDAAPIPPRGRVGPPEGAARSFLVLLDAAGPRTHFALLPHLDPRTLLDLFAYGVWRREWFDHLVEHGTPAQRLAFARTGARVDPARIQRLLDLGEPALSAALLSRREMTGPPSIAPRRRHDDHPPIAVLDAGADFAEAVAAGAGLTENTTRYWVGGAVATARATWSEVLRHLQPARLALDLCRSAHRIDRLPALAEVVGSVGAETLALALELLGDFEGTLPELLAVAAAAVGSGPDHP